MSASLSPLPNLAVVASNLLANGGESDATSSSAGEPQQFAACFEFLLGRQMKIEPATESLPRISTEDFAGDDSIDDLAALLPFIEALGMTQTAATIPVEARPESGSDNAATPANESPAVPAVALPAFFPASTATATGNPAATASVTTSTARSATTANIDTAATITNPAVSPSSATTSAPTLATPAVAGVERAASRAAPFSNAVPGPAIPPAQEVLASMADIASLPAGPAAPAISAANATPQGQANGFAVPLPAQIPTAETSLAPVPTAVPNRSANAEALSAGGEFASQLVATIAASKEAQHLPGTTADAVQNVIAQAVPGRASVQEAAPVISQAVGAPGWSEEISNRVAWMAGHSESRAELVLNPPQMGRVEVNLTLKGDLATASFASSNPVVREALEAALPRLREVLADAGIQLGQTQVGAENAHQWTQQEKNGDNSTSDLGRRNAADPASSRISSGSLPTTAALKTGRGFVDVFA